VVSCCRGRLCLTRYPPQRPRRVEGPFLRVVPQLLGGCAGPFADLAKRLRGARVWDRVACQKAAQFRHCRFSARPSPAEAFTQHRGQDRVTIPDSARELAVLAAEREHMSGLGAFRRQVNEQSPLSTDRRFARALNRWFGQ
jgi:hypothetical protein